MIFWEKQKTITALYERVTKPICDKYNLTQMEYDILMFLHNNPQYKTAADIIKVRKLTKSHVSLSLKSLEEKKLIRRSFANGNKKNILISPTTDAIVIIADGEQVQRDFGHTLFQGFTEEEFKLCKEFFVRMCDNAEKEMEVI